MLCLASALHWPQLARTQFRYSKHVIRAPWVEATAKGWSGHDPARTCGSRAPSSSSLTAGRVRLWRQNARRPHTAYYTARGARGRRTQDGAQAAQSALCYGHQGMGPGLQIVQPQNSIGHMSSASCGVPESASPSATAKKFDLSKRLATITFTPATKQTHAHRHRCRCHHPRYLNRCHRRCHRRYHSAVSVRRGRLTERHETLKADEAHISGVFTASVYDAAHHPALQKTEDIHCERFWTKARRQCRLRSRSVVTRERYWQSESAVAIGSGSVRRLPLNIKRDGPASSPGASAPLHPASWRLRCRPPRKRHRTRTRLRGQPGHREEFCGCEGMDGHTAGNMQVCCCTGGVSQGGMHRPG